MRGFVKRMVERRLRRLVIGSTIGMAILTAAAVAAGRFHDPKFDEADLAVEKAQILLGVAECGNPGEKTTKVCQKELKRALEVLAKARATINAAAVAADGGL
jgi:hypothetical protein